MHQSIHKLHVYPSKSSAPSTIICYGAHIYVYVVDRVWPIKSQKGGLPFTQEDHGGQEIVVAMAGKALIVTRFDPQLAEEHNEQPEESWADWGTDANSQLPRLGQSYQSPYSF